MISYADEYVSNRRVYRATGEKGVRMIPRSVASVEEWHIPSAGKGWFQEVHVWKGRDQEVSSV